MCLALRNTERRSLPVSTGRLRFRRVLLVRRSLRSLTFMLIAQTSARGGLARLETDLLARVADALAVVGVGRPYRADVGGHLPDGLLVDAAHLDLGGLRRGEGDALERLDDDGVREPEAPLEVLALHLAAEAHPVDLELAGVALGDAHDGVGDQRPRQPVLGARLAVVRAAGH